MPAKRVFRPELTSLRGIAQIVSMNRSASRPSIAAVLLVCMGMLAAGTVRGQKTAPVVAGQTPAAGILRGIVKAGNIPLPGVSIIATDTVTGKKYAATTDETGAFQMTVPAAARYSVRAEFAAFAPLTQTIALTAPQTEQTAAFAMQLASRVEAHVEAARQNASSRSATSRGTQSLSLLNSAPDAAPAAGAADTAASLPGAPDASAATDSVAVTGQVGSTNALGSMTEDEIRQRVQDAITQGRAQGMQNGDIASSVGDMIGGMMGGGGGFGGGGRGGGGGGGRGSFRNFNPTQPHGAIFYTGGNSALNTRGFFANGPPPVTPSYNSNQYGVTLSGSPYIPGLFKPSTKQFVFLNFTGMKSSKQSVFNAIVPTAAQQGGNFSAPGNNPLYIQNSPTPTNMIPPCGGTITTNCITPQAIALLTYYPLPNEVPTTTSSTNYQRVVSPASDSNTIALRYVRNFGQAGGTGFGGRGGGGRRQQGGKPTLRQNINSSFNYQHAANDIDTAFPAFGGNSATNSLAFSTGYTIGYGRLTNNLSLAWNRSHAITHNYFTGISNPANTPGAVLNLGDRSTYDTQDNPLNYGIPGVSFAQFTGFNDTTPADRINQTISFSENSAWNHRKHNVHFGFDVRRIHLDTLAGTNVLGSYTFTGWGTCKLDPPVPPSTTPNCAQNTGSDFADFLLGLPQQSAIQASNFKYYLRGNAWDLFVQDDWRIRPNLTLNFGLRYEYFSPYGEKYDHLANLDISFDPLLNGVTQVAPNAIGITTGTKYPHTLVYPDRNNFSPRFGFAWKPPSKFGKPMVVRGGYGINYNTSQYSTFALRLASEPPFADTQTNIADSNGCPTYPTWTSAFNCSTSTVSNNYAVNPHYRLGYVQIWNFGVQYTLPLQTVLNIDYTGSKGTRLDMVREPNRGVTTIALPGVDSFNYEDSLAGSHLNALAINLRERLQHGVSLGATYTYAHSIDNASSIGGTATVIAQNDQNLRAEEGNSSFDVRQKISGTWLFELPFGPNTLFLNSNRPFSRIVAGWSLSGDYTFATGTPLTPHYSGLSTEVSGGSNGSYRPNRLPGTSLTAGGGSYLQWFNTAAFVMPPGGGYGNASRNSIPGPGTVSIDAALSKTIQLGTTRSFEMRASATNVFNTVQYTGVDTNLNSRTYGQVDSTSSSRQITVLARYRF
jgi:trimeric autotransporter adhesin